MIISIESLIIRDLNTLSDEINSLKSEDLLWKTLPGISNSIGNLSLHLCGNLQHFIGAILGNSGYIRKRDEEFTAKDVSISEISQLIEETKRVVKNTLSQIKNEELSEIYPIPFLNREVKKGELLLILVSHFAYHLGQVNYLKRILQ